MHAVNTVQVIFHLSNSTWISWVEHGFCGFKQLRILNSHARIVVYGFYCMPLFHSHKRRHMIKLNQWYKVELINDTQFNQWYTIESMIYSWIKVDQFNQWYIVESRIYSWINDMQLIQWYTVKSRIYSWNKDIQFYFILSSEINAYPKQIKVTSITSEMIWYQSPVIEYRIRPDNYRSCR